MLPFLLFSDNKAIIMPASYKMIKGTAIIPWVITSGGVSMAAKVNANNMAYFRFAFNN